MIPSLFLCLLWFGELKISFMALDITSSPLHLCLHPQGLPGAPSVLCCQLPRIFCQLGFFDCKQQKPTLAKQKGDGKADEPQVLRLLVAGSSGTRHWHESSATISPSVGHSSEFPGGRKQGSLTGSPTKTAHSGRVDEFLKGELGCCHLTKRNWIMGRPTHPYPRSTPGMPARTQ